MTVLTRVLTGLAMTAARRPGLVLGVGGVIVLLSLVAVLRLGVSSSLAAMFGLDSPASRAMARVGSDYHASDELLILAELPRGRPGSDAGVLRGFATRLERAIWSHPQAARLVAAVQYEPDPEYAAFVREVALSAVPFYLSDAGFEEFLARLTPEGMEQQLRRAEALLSAPGPATAEIAGRSLKDPLRIAELVDDESLGAPLEGNGEGDRPLLLSDNGRTLLIRVVGVRPVDHLRFSAQLTAEIGDIAARENRDGLSVRLAGGYAIAATTARGIRTDMIRSVLVAVACVHLLFFAVYRQILSPVLLVGTTGAGILVGFGVFGTWGGTLTPLTATIGAMLAGLGIDYGIHLLSHFQAERRSGVGVSEAVRAAVRSMGVPILMSAATTVMGFSAMAWSSVAMLRSFSALGALSIAGCLLGVMTLLPAMLRLTERRPSTAAQPARLLGVARAVTTHRTACLTIGAVVLFGQVCAVLIVGRAPMIESDLSVMHPHPNHPLELTEQLGSRFTQLGETMPIEVSGESPRDVLQTAHAAADALTPETTDRVVVGVLGVQLLIPEPHRADERLRSLAELSSAEVAQRFDAAVARSEFREDAFEGYGAFLAKIVESEPPGLEDLAAYPALAKRLFPSGTGAVWPPTRTLLAVRVAGPVTTRSERDAAVEQIRGALRGIPTATLSGMSAVAYDLENATRGDLPRLIVAAFGLILAGLVLSLHRPRLVALALIPMLSGAVFSVSAIVLGGIRLNALNGAALPLLLGVTVDSGLLLVAFASGAARLGRSADFGPVVHAVIVSALTTLLGFGALGLTATPAIRSLGMLACVGILGSLWGSVMVLVPLLVNGNAEGSS